MRSASGPAGFPADGLPEVALVGRSNVGKSSLINSLVRRDVARTSAAPGKTRLVNLYRVELDGPAGPLYLADLPGYGHAGGGDQAAKEFDRLTAEYFRDQESGVGDLESGIRDRGSRPGHQRARAGQRRWIAGVVLAVDARHPGLRNDVTAHRWLAARERPLAIVATKADKLSQAERARSSRTMETVFGVAPLTVSAATGEGLDQLWRILLTWIRRP